MEIYACVEVTLQAVWFLSFSVWELFYNSVSGMEMTDKHTDFCLCLVGKKPVLPSSAFSFQHSLTPHVCGLPRNFLLNMCLVFSLIPEYCKTFNTCHFYICVSIVFPFLGNYSLTLRLSLTNLIAAGFLYYWLIIPLWKKMSYEKGHP